MTERSGYEFPDEAGYPDGTGTLDEGTRAAAADDAAAEEIDEFAGSDEEDVEGV